MDKCSVSNYRNVMSLVIVKLFVKINKAVIEIIIFQFPALGAGYLASALSDWAESVYIFCGEDSAALAGASLAALLLDG